VFESNLEEEEVKIDFSSETHLAIPQMKRKSEIRRDILQMLKLDSAV
jgi:hypothetical protein